MGRTADVEHRATDVSGGAADADQRQGRQRERQVPDPVEQPAPGREEIGIESGRAEGRKRPGPVGEDHHQHESQPVTRHGKRVTVTTESVVSSLPDFVACIAPTTMPRT